MKKDDLPLVIPDASAVGAPANRDAEGSGSQETAGISASAARDPERGLRAMNAGHPPSRSHAETA